MPDPIIEQIAAKLLTAAQQITTANGYFGNATVERSMFTPASPNDYQIILSEGDAARDPDQPSNADEQIAWLAPFAFACFVRESKDSTVPLNRRLNLIWADVVRAVMADPTLGDLARGRPE